MLDSSIAQRVKDALFGQKYNLLLGAGISLDSTDRRGKKLQSTEELRQDLCSLTGSRTSSPLWRVAGLLTPAQIQTHISDAYHGCKAGPTLRKLPHFAWRVAFTLNIDDALEDAYESDAARLQSVLPINYTREYETFRNPKEIPLIHLHGFVRQPTEGYVFSLQEYANLQRTLNPWVHALSGLIISEPFIIAGTALFEPDLEYFLASRPSISTVLARAPSILVEPFPDAGTRKDCEKLNLTLVEATLGDFLDWLLREFGPPPTPLALRAPAVRPRVTAATSSIVSTAFWSDFEFVCPTATDPALAVRPPTAFTYGRAPTWQEIHSSLDVPLRAQLPLIDELRRWVASSDASRVVCVSGPAGSGKSTTLKRVATDLAGYGLPIFYLRAAGGFDIDSAADFFSTVIDPLIVAVDSLAEHGDQLAELLARLGATKRVCVFGFERQYRMAVVKEILSEIPATYVQMEHWRQEERIELIRRYSTLGIVGASGAITDVRRFASSLARGTAAESVCRILNDFRPLATIVRSLWNDTFADRRPVYLAVALAHYCHPFGVRRQIISAAYSHELVAELAQSDVPLQVAAHPDDPELLIPANSTLASLLLKELAKHRKDRLLDVTARLANALAPYVTRHTIRQRTIEARLAGRLFDADGVMPELLGQRFEAIFDLTYDRWKWNSRYWEQRALWVRQNDRALAIQHARHAVSIERHPYPLTTLAQILFTAASEDPPSVEYFSEALTLMDEALGIEATWARGRTRKAYRVVLDGVGAYLDHGTELTPRQRMFIGAVAADAKIRFPDDVELDSCATEIAAKVNAGTG